MQKFLVLYMAPATMMEEWMKKPEEERKAEEQKMQAEWGVWMAAHKDHLKQTAGAGKTKRVSKEGVMDTKNDIMLFSLVEGDGPDAVAEMFKDHPHFGIPGATIEVMPVNYLPGMAGM